MLVTRTIQIRFLDKDAMVYSELWTHFTSQTIHMSHLKEIWVNVHLLISWSLHASYSKYTLVVVVSVAISFIHPIQIILYNQHTTLYSLITDI